MTLTKGVIITMPAGDTDTKQQGRRANCMQAL
jgi:hypothetical protein